MNKKNLKVSIVMGSQSDFKTMKLAKQILKKLKVPIETKIISAEIIFVSMGTLSFFKICFANFIVLKSD